MPKNALANDNWIGRESMVVRNASQGTKWLSCLGRACWRQVRLGRGAPDTQQRGLSGNTILLAQPTASIPSLEQPPPEDALVDALSVVFARGTGSLDGAQWATVSREDYLAITRLRRHCCPAYANAVLVEGAAETRLPSEPGVPDAIAHCVQKVDGVDRAPV